MKIISIKERFKMLHGHFSDLSTQTLFEFRIKIFDAANCFSRPLLKMLLAFTILLSEILI